MNIRNVFNNPSPTWSRRPTRQYGKGQNPDLNTYGPGKVPEHAVLLRAGRAADAVPALPPRQVLTPPAAPAKQDAARRAASFSLMRARLPVRLRAGARALAATRAVAAPAAWPTAMPTSAPAPQPTVLWQTAPAASFALDGQPLGVSPDGEAQALVRVVLRDARGNVVEAAPRRGLRLLQHARQRAVADALALRRARCDRVGARRRPGGRARRRQPPKRAGHAARVVRHAHVARAAHRRGRGRTAPRARRLVPAGARRRRARVPRRRGRDGARSRRRCARRRRRGTTTR